MFICPNCSSSLVEPNGEPAFLDNKSNLKCEDCNLIMNPRGNRTYYYIVFFCCFITLFFRLILLNWSFVSDGEIVDFISSIVGIIVFTKICFWCIAMIKMPQPVKKIRVQEDNLGSAQPVKKIRVEEDNLGSE